MSCEKCSGSHICTISTSIQKAPSSDTTESNPHAMKFIPCTYDTAGLYLANAHSTRRSGATPSPSMGSPSAPTSVRRRSFSI